MHFFYDSEQKNVFMIVTVQHTLQNNNNNKKHKEQKEKKLQLYSLINYTENLTKSVHN